MSKTGDQRAPQDVVVCELVRPYNIREKEDDEQEDGGFAKATIGSDDDELSVNWLTVDPSQYHWISGFSNRALRREFRRFVYRDCILTWIGLVYSGTALLASLIDLDRESKPLWTKIWEVPANLIVLVSSIIDWMTYIGQRGVESQETAKRRWILRHTIVVGITLQTSIHLHSTNFCEQGQDCLLGESIIFLAAMVPTCVVAAARLEPLHGFALAMMYAVLLIIGDNWVMPATLGPDPHFTMRDAFASGIMYLTMALIGTAAGALRYSAAVGQFQTRCALEKSQRLASKLRAQVDVLMASTLPAFVLERHLEAATGGNDGLATPTTDSFDEATVFFSDIAGFTRWSSTRSPHELVKMLNLLVIQFDNLAQHYGLVKIATIGDAYFCVGLMHPTEDRQGVDYTLLEEADAESVAQFALAAQAAVAKTSRENFAEWGSLKIRVGVHTGPVQGTVVGRSMQHYEVYGPTVDVAAQCEQQGQPGAVCVSETTARRLRMIPNFFVSGPDGDRVDEMDGDSAVKESSPAFGKIGDIQTYLLPTVVDEANSSMGSVRSASYRASVYSLSTPGMDSYSKVSRYSDTGSRLMRRRDTTKMRAAKNAERQNAAQQQATQEQHQALLVNKVRAKQRGKRGDAVEEGTTTAVDVATEFAPAHSCCFNNFANGDHEVKYAQWRIERSHSLTLWMRILQLIFTLMIPVCMLIGDETQISATGLVLLVLATATLIVTIVMAKKLDETQTQSAYIAGAVLQYLAAMITAFSLLTFNAGTMSNDASYALVLGVFCPAVGIPMASVFHAVFVLTFTTATALALLVVSSFALANVMGVTFAISAQLWLIAIFGERMMRQAYTEVTAAEAFSLRREQDSVDRQVALEQVLPGHAVRRLLAFVEADNAHENKSVAPVLSKENTQKKNVNNKTRALSVVSSTPTDNKGIAEVHPVTAIMFVDFAALASSDRHTDTGVQANASPAWLVAHSIADGVLSQWPESVLTKVKSIGSILIIAGPFPDPLDCPSSRADCEGEALAESVVALVSFASRLVERLSAYPEVSQHLACRTGLHVGRTISTVLGIERLCFDLFGDALNTTSRLMTSGLAPTVPGSMVVTASDEFAELLSGAQNSKVVWSAGKINHGEAAATGDKTDVGSKPTEDGDSRRCRIERDVRRTAESVSFPSVPEVREIRSKGLMNVRTLTVE